MKAQKKIEEKINSLLKVDAVLMEIGYRTDTINTQGENIRCFCPIHRETLFRSLTVNSTKNTYKCGFTQCSGFMGGDLIDLYTQSLSIPRDESVLFWAKYLKMEKELKDDSSSAGTKGAAAASKTAAGDTKSGSTSTGKTKPKETAKPPVEIKEEPIAVVKKAEKPRVKAVDLDELKLMAKQTMEKGDYQKAYNHLESILAQEPEDQDALLQMGVVLLKLGKTKEGITLLKTTAESFRKRKQYANAAETYRIISRADPAELTWNYTIIELFLDAKNHPEALREQSLLLDKLEAAKKTDDMFPILEKIAALEPKDADIIKKAINKTIKFHKGKEAEELIILLVQLFISICNPKEAIHILEEVLRVFTKDIDMYRSLIDILSQQGMIDDSLKYTKLLIQIYQEKSNWEAMVPLFDQMIRLEPKNLDFYQGMAQVLEKLNSKKDLIEVYSRMATIAFNQGDHKTGLLCLQKALLLEPENLTLLEAITSAYIKTKDIPKSIEALNRLAAIYKTRGDAKKAQKYLEQVVKLQPENAQSHINLGEMLQGQKNPEEMIQHFISAAQALYKKKEFQKALDPLRRSIPYTKNKIDLLLMQADIYRQIRQVPRALASLSRVAKYYAKSKQYQDALKVCKTALAINQESLALHVQLAGYYEALEMLPDAGKEYARIGIQFQKQKKMPQAIQYMEKSRVCLPEETAILDQLLNFYEETVNPEQTASLSLQLGQLAKDKGSYKKAIGYFERGLKIAPEDVPLLEATIETFLKGGSTTQALKGMLSLMQLLNPKKDAVKIIETGKSILKLDPKNIEIHELLVQAYTSGKDKDNAALHLTYLGKLSLMNKDAEKAVEYFQKVIAITPANIEALKILAEYYLKEKKLDPAFEVMEKLAKALSAKEMNKESALVYQNMVRMRMTDIGLREILAEQYLKAALTQDCLMEYDVISTMYFEQKNYKKVKSIYDRMDTILPNNPDVQSAIERLKKITSAK